MRPADRPTDRDRPRRPPTPPDDDDTEFLSSTATHARQSDPRAPKALPRVHVPRRALTVGLGAVRGGRLRGRHTYTLAQAYDLPSPTDRLRIRYHCRRDELLDVVRVAGRGAVSRRAVDGAVDSVTAAGALTQEKCKAATVLRVSAKLDVQCTCTST